MNARRPWVIVGAGRVGRMMGLWAQDAGVEVAAAWNRTSESASETRALLDVECVSGALPDALAGLKRQ